jgi:hypothetical protein
MSDVAPTYPAKTSLIDKIKKHKWVVLSIVIAIIVVLILIIAVAKEYMNPYDPMTLKMIQAQAAADPRVSQRANRQECMLPYNPKYFYPAESMENPELVKMLYGK